MKDIAALTRQCHDHGFEQGSMAACNAILSWLNSHGHAAIASDLLLAWEAGEVAEIVGRAPSPEASAASAPAAASMPVMTRDAARVAGYIGDPCSSCQSMQVKRNGSCLVCEACGQTTGCS